MFNLSAFRFLDILTTIRKARKNEEKERFEQSAFVAWQIIEFAKSAISNKSKGMSFEKYLKELGIIEKQKTTKAERMQDIARKLRRAEEIKAKDQKREVK